MSELRSLGGDSTKRIERCVVVWWKGYVKGRFQAQLESEAVPPVVVAESPVVRWRGDVPPDPNDVLVSALAELAGSLRAAGWNVEGTLDDTWYGLAFSRPATAQAETPPVTEIESPPLEREGHESPAVVRLRSELVAAWQTAEHERQLRREAERRAALEGISAPRTPPPTAAGRRRFWIVVEAVAIAAAAAFFLLGFGSLYAAGVAALTTAAVCLGFDSYLATRPRRIAR